MRNPGSLATATAVLAVAAAGLAFAGGSGQAPASQTIPHVAGRIDQIVVDVVVLDRKGLPVTGLSKEDFTVLEEGQPQTIANFELIDRKPGASLPPAPVQTRVSTNAAPDPGLQAARTFVILFDDINLTQASALHAKNAVTAFLDGGAVEGDRVTLFTTSGSAWWSTQMMGGREDLLSILKRLEGRRVLETAAERITDYEAVQIVYYRDVLVAARVQDRLERYGTKMLQAPDKANERNAQDFFQRGVVDPFVENLALQTFVKAKVRMGASLETIERAIRALTEERSRKALVLVSEGFVDDPTQVGPRRVVEAARRANATLYFIDANGLRALDPMYAAEFGPALDSRDTMTAIADLSQEGDGAVVLADRTGGFSIRDTNGFAEGAIRIGRESQSYYLLGYSPGDVPRDGRFRKIEVKVRGAARYTVRARRGYYAPTGDTDAPPPGPKGVDAVLQQALDAPGSFDAIPLRATTYLMEQTDFNRTHVVVAADVDVSGVTFADVDGKPQASLDTLVVVAHRDTSEALRTDQRVDIQRRPGSPGGGPVWYSFLRDFNVAAGQHQIKLIVRDTATNRVGTLIHRFSVPGKDEFRVSTPVLSDAVSGSGGGSGLVLVTERAFPETSQLYCRFDVFGAALGPDGQPRVRAGHALRRGGDMLGRAAPTVIQPTSIGALARMIQIPLRAYPPGDYELLLTVTDEVRGVTRELVEPFTITPPAAASR